jgi:hypothetical protein
MSLDDLGPVAAAATRGDLPQRITVTGGPRLAATASPAPLARGPVKLVVADYAQALRTPTWSAGSARRTRPAARWRCTA